MATRPKSAQYTNIATEVDETHERQTSLPRRDYKPIAIRAPVLISFGLILAVCLALVELLLRGSSPEPAKNDGARQLRRREDATCMHSAGCDMYTMQVENLTSQLYDSRRQVEVYPFIEIRSTNGQNSETLSQLLLPLSSIRKISPRFASVRIRDVSSTSATSHLPSTTTTPVTSSPPPSSTTVRSGTSTTVSNAQLDLSATTSPLTTTTISAVSQISESGALLDTSATTTSKSPTTVPTMTSGGLLDTTATTTTSPTTHKTYYTTEGGLLDTTATTTTSPQGPKTESTTRGVLLDTTATTTTPQGQKTESTTRGGLLDTTATTTTPQGQKTPSTTRGGLLDTTATTTTSPTTHKTYYTSEGGLLDTTATTTTSSKGQKTESTTRGGLLDTTATTKTIPIFTTKNGLLDTTATATTTTSPQGQKTESTTRGGLLDTTATTTTNPTNHKTFYTTKNGLLDTTASTTTVAKDTTTNALLNLSATTSSRYKPATPTGTKGGLLDTTASSTSPFSTLSATPTGTRGGLLDTTASSPSPSSTLPRITLSTDLLDTSATSSPHSSVSGNHSGKQTTQPNLKPTNPGRISSDESSKESTTPSTNKHAVSTISGETFTSLYAVETSVTTLVTTTDADGHVSTFSAIAVYTTIVSTDSSSKPTDASKATDASNTSELPASTTTSDPTSTQSLVPIATLGKYEFIYDGKFTAYSYFGALYAPALVAVMIKIFWEIVFAAFKMMEPFERMYKVNGEPAKQTLFAQYLSNSLSFDAFSSLFRGSLLPALTSLVYLLVMALAPLSTASMTVRARAICDVGLGVQHRCMAAWVVNIFLLRALEATLATCVLMSLFVLIFSWRTKNGLSSAPSSIASLAALFNHDPLIRDFRQIAPRGDNWTLESTFPNHPCRLGYHQAGHQSNLYGIECRLSVLPEASVSAADTFRLSDWRTWFGGYSSVPNPAPLITTSRSWYNLSNTISGRILDFLQFFSSLGLFAVLLAYTLDGKNDPFNNFFNTPTFWPRVVLVTAASVVDMQWKRLEREVRITEPYRRLSKRFAPPETTVLVNLHGTPWSELPKCVYRLMRYPYMGFPTLITAVAALSDFNIVVVAGVPYSDGQTWIGLRVCAFSSCAITGLMTVTMAFTMFWWRRGVIIKMPRCPETIGDVLSYLCASSMTKDFSSGKLDELSERQRDRAVMSSGRRFWFGWMVGADGIERWAVDYEDSHGKAEVVEDVETRSDISEHHDYQYHPNWSEDSIPTAYRAQRREI